MKKVFANSSVCHTRHYAREETSNEFPVRMAWKQEEIAELLKNGLKYARAQVRIQVKGCYEGREFEADIGGFT